MGPVRGLLVMGLLGCGRLGFDQNSTPSPDPDGAPGDGTPVAPNLCNPRVAGAITLGVETPIKVRATTLSTGGYAVAVETDATNVYVLRLDATGAVVSQHAPMNIDYRLQGISQIEGRPFVYVFTAGAGYIKILEPDWNTYITGPAGELVTVDPQQALLPGGTTAMFGVVQSGQMLISTVDVANTTGVTADYGPVATSGSFAATPSGARVVVARPGECETFAVATDGTTGTRSTIADCDEPLIAMLDDTRGAFVFRTPTGLAVQRLPSGTITPLGDRSNPRIAVHDGAIWVAYLQNGVLHVLRFAGNDPPTEIEFPPIATAFDLLPTAAFWVDAGELHTADPCL